MAGKYHSGWGVADIPLSELTMMVPDGAARDIHHLPAGAS